MNIWTSCRVSFLFRSCGIQKANRISEWVYVSICIKGFYPRMQCRETAGTSISHCVHKYFMIESQEQQERSFIVQDEERNLYYLKTLILHVTCNQGLIYYVLYTELLFFII